MSGTMPHALIGKSAATLSDNARMPDFPAIKRDQFASTPQPSGETAPIPVTTMRRMALLRFTISPQVADKQRTPACRAAAYVTGGKVRRRIASWRSRSVQLALDSDGGRFAATDAQRGDAALNVVVFHCVQQRDDQSRTGCTDRMAERASAAIDV